MKTERTFSRHYAAALLMLAAFVVFIHPVSAQIQNSVVPERPSNYDDDKQAYLKNIDDLIYERMERERIANKSQPLYPEILRVEANYIRTDAQTGEVVLFESSFHLEPRYISMTAEGREITDKTPKGRQTAMYFVGSARTPLALPLVSNLSKVLRGDDASYTVHLGILPIPHTSDIPSDSLRFYCVIERAIESNRSESFIKFERYAKEFAFRIGQPIQLRLENTPPDKQAYIIKIEDNSEPLNFYEDFARHFREHIIVNSERLKFELGKATLSTVTSQLSIPYTIGSTANVRLELLSVVDDGHPVVIVDSVMKPADYLAQFDAKPLIDGTYRYRITARDITSGETLFEQTLNFEKRQPVMISRGIDIAKADTLEVGGKKYSAQKRLEELNLALQVERVKTERLEANNAYLKDENQNIRTELEAKRGDVIAGIRGRGGLGFGGTTGYNVFIGVESSMPSLTLDLSYGLLYGGAPYLSYEDPQNLSQIFSSPKSLGLQIGWSPVSLFEGRVQPIVRLGYYGIYSAETPATAGGRHSATLIAPVIGIMTTPAGPGTNFGADLTFGPAFGLGINDKAAFDLQLKFYLRF